LRNVFDQYSQPENQLTHALVSALHQDRSVLLKSFLEWVGAESLPDTHDIKIVEQQQPGVVISGEEFDGEMQNGLPDATFFDDDGWALLVESKVQAPLNSGQLIRHRSTAQRCGFPNPEVLVIVVDRSEAAKVRGASVIEWRELYAWFRRQRKKSRWAQHLTDYFEIFESKNLADRYNIRGTLTMFDGFHFDDEHPFHYREAKRLLRLLGEELRKSKELKALGVDLEAPGRGMITGSQGGVVWDYLQFKAAGGDGRSRWPHLTYALRPDGLGAMLNFPNQLSGGLKSMFTAIGADQLQAVLTKIGRNLQPILGRVEGSAPHLEVIQRHYPSRTAQPIVDGRIHADLRTLFQAKSPVKHQPEWLNSAFRFVANKNSNLQFGIAVRFTYNSAVVQSPNIEKEFVNSWVAMKPLIDLGLEHVEAS